LEEERAGDFTVAHRPHSPHVLGYFMQPPCNRQSRHGRGNSGLSCARHSG
jgi:hypothetical protein